MADFAIPRFRNSTQVAQAAPRKTLSSVLLALRLGNACPVSAAPLGAGLAERDRVLRAVHQEGVAGHAELRAVLVVAAVACALGLGLG